VILPDVNVLIYAFRFDSVDHAQYKDWLEGIVNGPAAYGISPQVLAAVVRICTHPKVFKEPSSTNETFEFCDILLTQQNATVIEPRERHWHLFRKLSQDAKANGNLVPDAWNAALAIESGCEWITTDRDYSRFPGLRWRLPF
jgi:uncharacterized protein